MDWRLKYTNLSGRKKDKISDDYCTKVDELPDNYSSPDFLAPLDEEEVNEIWSGISSDLDIDEVWQDIHSGLDKTMPTDTNSGIILKFIATVLIILAGMIPVKVAKPDINTNPQKNPSEITQIDPPVMLDREDYLTVSNVRKQAMPDNSSELVISLDESKDIRRAAPLKSTEYYSSRLNLITTDDELFFKALSVPQIADSNSVGSRDKVMANESITGMAILPHDFGSVNTNAKADLNILKKMNPEPFSRYTSTVTDKGRISGGYITMFKNTWLLNHETFDGLKSESLNTTEIVIFPDVGLSLNYQLNARWSVQSDAFFYSNTGQKYLGYIYGHYSRKSITLRYSTIAVSAKYRFIAVRGFIPISSINLLAGGYVSVLHHADQKINSDVENIVSQYGRYDLGVRLGSEIEFPVHEYFSLAPGIFLSYGIPNIYRGDGYIPGYLRRTHNGSAEFHITFYYHF